MIKRLSIPEREAMMEHMIKAIQPHLPDGWCLMLIAHPMGDHTHSTYACNMKRDAAIKMLQHTLSSFKREEELSS